MRHLLLAIFLISAVFLLLPGPALAAAPTRVASCADGSTPAWFNLQTSPVQDVCYSEFVPPLSQVYVVAIAVPFRKARFSLPDPTFGTVVGETWNFPHTGDRINGIELSLVDCSVAGPMVLGTLSVFAPGGITGCVPWKINDGCEIEDCDGVTRAGVARTFNFGNSGMNCDICFQQCQTLPPHALAPADGATDVPINTMLSWDGTPDPQYGETGCFVHISTAGPCDSEQDITVPCGEHTFAPGLLEPYTTYYWRVSYELYFSGCSSGDREASAVHSFQTAGPLAVEPSTWGRVKSLYKE